MGPKVARQGGRLAAAGLFALPRLRRAAARERNDAPQLQSECKLNEVICYLTALLVPRSVASNQTAYWRLGDIQDTLQKLVSALPLDKSKGGRNGIF